MNDAAGSMWFRAGMDNSQLERDTQKTKQLLKGVGDTAKEAGKEMDNSLSGIGSAVGMTLATVSLAGFGKEIFDITAKFEKFGIVLKNTLGDIKGQASLDMIAEFTATTPFQLDEVTAAFIKMSNQGFTPTREEMVKLGDVASSTGKSFDQLAEAILDAQTNQFERLKEFGIKASAAGDKVTFTFKEQSTTVANTASAIRAYIIGLGEMNGIMGANAAISGSLTGQLSNLKDKLDMMFNDIGKANSGLLYAALDGAGYLIQNYEEIGKVIIGIAATYGTWKTAVIIQNAVLKEQAAINAMVAASNGVFTKELAAQWLWTERLQAAQARLNATIFANPYVLATAAIVALGFAIYKVATYTTEAEAAQNKLNEAVKNSEQAMATEQASIDAMFARLKAAKEGTDEWGAAKKAIQDKYGEYLKGLGAEGIALNNVALAYRTISEEAQKSAKIRAMDNFMQDASKERGIKVADARTELKTTLDNKLKGQKGADGVSLAETYFWKIVPVLEGKEKMTAEVKGIIDSFNQNVTTTNAWGQTTQTITNPIKALMVELDKSKAIFDETVKQATIKFGEGTKVVEPGKEIETAQAKVTKQRQDLAASELALEREQKKPGGGNEQTLKDLRSQIKANEQELADAIASLELERKKNHSTPEIENLRAQIAAKKQLIAQSEKQGEVDEKNATQNAKKQEKTQTSTTVTKTEIKTEKQVLKSEVEKTVNIKTTVSATGVEDTKKKLEDVDEQTKKGSRTQTKTVNIKTAVSTEGADEAKKKLTEVDEQAQKGVKTQNKTVNVKTTVSASGVDKTNKELESVDEQAKKGSKPLEKKVNVKTSVTSTGTEETTKSLDDLDKRVEKGVKNQQKNVTVKTSVTTSGTEDATRKLDELDQKTKKSAKSEEKTITIKTNITDAKVKPIVVKTEVESTQIEKHKKDLKDLEQQLADAMKAEGTTTYEAQISAKKEQLKELERKLVVAKATPGANPEKEVIEIEGQIDKLKKELGIHDQKAIDQVQVLKEAMKTAHGEQLDQLAEKLLIIDQINRKQEEEIEIAKKRAEGKMIREEDRKLLNDPDLYGFNPKAIQAKATDDGSYKNNAITKINEVKTFTQQMDAFVKKTEEAWKKADKSKLKDALAERSEMEDLGRGFLSAADDAAYLAQSIGNANAELSGLLSGAATLSGSLGKALQSGVMDGSMTKGDATSQIVSSVTDIADGYIKSMAQRKRVTDEFYKSALSAQSAYNFSLNEQLRINSEINGSVFLKDYAGSLNDGANAFNDAQTKLQESLAKLNQAKAITGTKDVVDGQTFLKDVVKGGVVGGIVGLFSKKTIEQTKPILDAYPELIKKNGEFNAELAKTLLANNRIEEGSKQIIQDIVDWSDAAKQAQEQIKGVISELTGSLSGDLRNVLVKAFTDGTSAAKDFEKSVDKVLENIISNMVFNTVFAGAFKELQDRMEASYAVAGDQSWLDDFQAFYAKSPELMRQFNEGMKNAKDAGKEAGFSLFDPTGNSTSMTNQVSQQITEDTGSSLVGLWNRTALDIRAMMATSKESLDHLIMIEAYTSRTADNTESLSKIAAIAQSLASIDKAVNKTASRI